MNTQTKIGIGVGLAVIAYLLFSKKASAAIKTPTTTSDANKTSGGGVPVVVPVTPVTPVTPVGGGETKDAPCPAGQTRIQVQCIQAPCPSMCMPDKIFDKLPDTPPSPVDVVKPQPIRKPQPIDCELFPENPACADVIKAPPIAIEPPDDIYIPKRKIPEPIVTPIYGGGGIPITPPYYNQPISPEPPIGRYYAYDPLPPSYEPPVSYEPAPPIYEYPYDPLPINKKLKPISYGAVYTYDGPVYGGEFITDYEYRNSLK